MPDPQNQTPPSLDALEAKIAEVRRRRAPPKPGAMAKGFKGVELAWRMVIDLAAGIAVGLAIGWGLDLAFGSKPLFMIVFVLLGFAAGIRVMLQSAKAAGGAQEKTGEGPAPETGPAGQGGAAQGAPEREDG